MRRYSIRVVVTYRGRVLRAGSTWHRPETVVAACRDEEGVSRVEVGG